MRSAESVVYVVSRDVANGQLLRELFASCGIHVVLFSSAARYSSLRRDERPACLIVNLEHLDVSGLDFQRNLAETGAPPVIFMAAHADPASCVRAVKSGAVDVLLDPFDHKELLASVETAFARDQQRRNDNTERASLLTRWKTLTPRESEVFYHTVAGLLNKQGAGELGVAENTYQVHRGRVMRKMQANSLADLVRMSMKLEPILHDNENDGARNGQARRAELARAKHVQEGTALYFRSNGEGSSTFAPRPRL